MDIHFFHSHSRKQFHMVYYGRFKRFDNRVFIDIGLKQDKQININPVVRRYQFNAFVTDSLLRMDKMLSESLLLTKSATP